jgi:hypothetical protein
MISAVPSVSSVHVELDGRLPSTAGRTDETTKVFGVTERSVRPRIPRPIYLDHPVRMTDGGFRDTYTIRMDGYFFFSGTKPIRNG